MKKLFISLAILSALFFNTAIAENSSEKHMSKKGKGGPMSVFKRTSPMPLLMSVIVKNADKLGLNEKQNAAFTQWRVENMGSSLKMGNEIIAAEKAISQASLEGKPTAEIEKMLSSILDKRHSIASSMLKCRNMIIKTLDKSQWNKLVALYDKKKKGMMKHT